MLMALWTATRPDWSPKAILSVLASTLRRHLLTLFAIPPFTLSWLWLPWKTLSFALLTPPMPISMALWRKRSTCSSQRDLKWVDLIMSVGLENLYGLKQAGRVWNQTLHSVLSTMGFQSVQSDHGLYIYLRDDLRVFIPVFVDDITLACKDSAKIDSVVQELSQHFKLRDLGPTTQLLGLEIHRDRPNHLLSISQTQYISNLIHGHGLGDSKPVSTPSNPGTRLSTSMCPQNNSEASEMHQHPYISVVGCLMYLAVATRPDIAYSAGVLARFNSNSGLAHWQAAKHVLRYLKGTMDYKPVYQPSTSPEPFITYSDADHGGNPDNG